MEKNPLWGNITTECSIYKLIVALWELFLGLLWHCCTVSNRCCKWLVTPLGRCDSQDAGEYSVQKYHNYCPFVYWLIFREPSRVCCGLLEASTGFSICCLSLYTWNTFGAHLACTALSSDEKSIFYQYSVWRRLYYISLFVWKQRMWTVKTTFVPF